MLGHEVGSTEEMGKCFTDLANRLAAPKSILPAPQRVDSTLVSGQESGETVDRKAIDRLSCC